MTGQALERVHSAAPAPLSDREMRSVEWQAKAITALDKRLEGTPAEKKALGEALAISLYSLGLPVTVTNAKKLHIINGEVVESAQLLTGLLAMHGHEVRVIEESEDRVVVRGRRHGAGEPYEVTYTAEQARSSGAFDEWVEKWEPTSSGKKYPVRYYLVFEGRTNEIPPEPWAKTLIDRGQVKRMDAWHKFRTDMLVNRALRRLAKRMGADALMGVGSAEWDEPAPGITARPDDVEGEVLDERDEQAIEVAEQETDEAAAHRNECTRLHAATARIPDGTWRQLWAKAWRDAGLPTSTLDLAVEQLEPARLLTRQYLALARLDSIGLRAPAERHDFVSAATGGATTSTKALGPEQLQAVLKACDEWGARRAEEAAAAPPADEEPEYGPGEEPF